MKKMQEYEIVVEKEDFHGHGSVDPMHKNCPNDDDLNKAKGFAKKLK